MFSHKQQLNLGYEVLPNMLVVIPQLYYFIIHGEQD